MTDSKCLVKPTAHSTHQTTKSDTSKTAIGRIKSSGMYSQTRKYLKIWVRRKEIEGPKSHLYPLWSLWVIPLFSKRMLKESKKTRSI